MCGIAGIIGERNIKKAKIIINKLTHRGPDGNDYWISPESEFPVTICHTRLAIIDLSDDGSQPFLSKDKRYVLTYNGEIYNYIELRKDLEKKGIKFRTNTDTEVLLEGLISEGDDFLLKCNGMWAFCLWDRKNNEALLCRDRFGIKPLFFSKDINRNFIFGSEMKSITPLLNKIEPSPQIDECLKYLFLYESTELCVINGINRVKPGYLLKYQNGIITEKKYWDSLDYIKPNKNKYPEQIEIWKDYFLKSVEMRMRSDVPIASALSGGLDSSSIVAAMHSISNKNSSTSTDWQHLFHCSFPNSSHDETFYAELVAKNLNLDLEKIIISPKDFQISIEKSMATVEDPYLTLSIPMLKTYNKMSKNGLKVSLDGQGADELFIGYGHIKKAFLCARTNKYLSELINIDESTRTGVYSTKAKRLKRIWAKERLYEFIHKKYVNVRNIIYPFMRNTSSNINLRNHRDYSAMQSHLVFQEMDIFSQSLYEIFHFTILPTLLRVYDRCSMANGVEMRLPFMDWNLVCFTFSLPLESKLGGTFTKRIQRDAMKGILDDSVLFRRSKLGWNSPAHEWFQKELKGNINSILDSNKSSKYYKKAKRAWNIFQNTKTPVWDDGQKAWLSILPIAWESSLKEDVWR